MRETLKIKHQQFPKQNGISVVNIEDYERPMQGKKRASHK
jgi:hypothetical protein